MRKLAKICIIVFLGLHCTGCFIQTNTPNNFFVIGRFGDSGRTGVLGVINNNKVQFYNHSNNTWVPSADFPDFTLPDGYKGIIGVLERTGGFGVITDNKIQFYSYNTKDNTWTVSASFPEFTLPDGYKGVFGLSAQGLGVIIDDKIKFYYANYDYTWIASSWSDFTLPKGYKGVFGVLGLGPPCFGVIINNKIQFYSFGSINDDYPWTAYNAFPEFTLPKGYKGIITGVSNSNLGVIIDNKIQFYTTGGSATWSVSTSLSEYIIK